MTRNRIRSCPPIPRRLIVSYASRRSTVNERERDKVYDSNYIGAGNTGRAKAKNDNGALSRVKAGSSAAFFCELCEITGLTLVELRAHYRKFHGDKS